MTTPDLAPLITFHTQGAAQAQVAMILASTSTTRGGGLA